MPISSPFNLNIFRSGLQSNFPFEIETAINVAPKLIQLKYDTNHLDNN